MAAEARRAPSLAGPGPIPRSHAPVPYPVGAPPSFTDRSRQPELHPEGLIARTLLQLMPTHDHDAHQAPRCNMWPFEVVRAGLVALSGHQVIARFRPWLLAELPRCLASFSHVGQDGKLHIADTCQRLDRSVLNGGCVHRQYTYPNIEGSSRAIQRCGAEGVPGYLSPDAAAEDGSRRTAWS